MRKSIIAIITNHSATVIHSFPPTPPVGVQVPDSSQHHQLVRGVGGVVGVAHVYEWVSGRGNSLAAIHDEWYQKTFTWCLGHCGVVGNEMADEQAKKELQPIKKASDTTTTLRRPP